MTRFVLMLLTAASLAACADMRPGRFGDGGPPDPGDPPRPAGDPRR